MSTHVGAYLQQLSTPYDTDQRSLNHLKRCEDYFHSSTSLIQNRCQVLSPIYINPLLVFSSSLLMKTSCLRLKLVELNFFASFNADDQRKPTFLTFLNILYDISNNI